MKNIKSKLVCVCMWLCLLFAMISPLASAYEEYSFHTEGTTTLYPYEGFSSATRTGMRESTNQWNAAAGKTLLKISSTTHGKTSNFKKIDGQDGIWKVWEDSAYVGFTYPTYGNMETGAYIEVDVNLNPKFKFANSAQPGSYDAYSVFLHEAGHVVGLGDLYSSFDKSKIMYGDFSTFTNITRRALTSDDKAGAKHIAQVYN